ncbi:MAG: hypothetical protein KatS3mg059_1590 [Thermomicrobiales bacterium]|nr:MAG: hypothetical protein KatS3mg059_1590 [Thermomicrobiales bacterium]
MRYCQDCGARNDEGATLCRICGHEIRHERGSQLCTSCGEYLAPGAAFCSSCGAATAAQRHAHNQLPVSLSVETAVAAERPVAAKRLEAAIDLSDGLELPDWLMRAAAEQPYDPTQATSVPLELMPPAIMDERAPGSTASGGQDGAAKAEPAAPSKAIPNGDLPTSLPAWLQQPPDTGAAQPAQPASAPNSPEPTDTTGFISESDLPEWIRQLAAAEEARKAEEARSAATASASEPESMSGGRRLLPGEIPPAEPVAQPWLARRERPAPSDATFIETWTRLRPASPAESSPANGDQRLEAPAASESRPVMADTSAPALESASRTRLSVSRVILVVAAALAVIAVVVALAFGG